MNYQYEYPRPAVAVDIVIIRQNESQPREVLLIGQSRVDFWTKTKRLNKPPRES